MSSRADIQMVDTVNLALNRARALVRLAEDVRTGSSGGVEAVPIVMQVVQEEIDKATDALAAWRQQNDGGQA